MNRVLVFQDNEGKVVRSFGWKGGPLSVVRRGDTHRLSLETSTDALKKSKIAYEDLGTISLENFKNKNTFLIGQLGNLQLIENVDRVDFDFENPKESKFLERLAYGFAATIGIAFFSLVAFAPKMTANIEEDLKQQVVKIVKHMEAKKVSATVNMNMAKDTPVPKSNKAQALKRVGALEALGSLAKSSQRAGLNLGAVNTTAGPGLGGTQGSGGVQTSIYGKGIVGAPVGVGGNINGAGGYGTQGKGGGKAGYGNLSLVGSAGTSPIPLGTEAIVGGGLDRDQIAAVIQKNIGQVRFCYEQGLQGNSSLNGRVAVDFLIDGQGVVQSAAVGSSSLNSKIVEDCLLLRLKTWRFPLPQGGVSVKVSYPFMLRRAGQG